MHALTGILVPLLVVLGVALIIWVVTIRFSPDETLTRVVQIVLFIMVLIYLVTKLMPLLA